MKEGPLLPILVLGLMLGVALAAPAADGKSGATDGKAAKAPQHSPYAGMEGRPIKALSQSQIEGYLNGAGMGLALPAELNGYPGPKHVLELKSELELDSTQIQATEKSFAAMKKSAVRLGQQIVARERELDSLFASGTLQGKQLEKLTREIGRLQGELRFTHLKAHLEMKKVLTPEQVTRYGQLRGYGNSHEGGAGHHHHSPSHHGSSRPGDPISPGSP